MMHKNKIALIGLMGSGKSTVGNALAAKLQVNFVDLDQEIEAVANMSINDIFLHHGEVLFRQFETEALKKVLQDDQAAVIATGGGVVIKEENRGVLQQGAMSIYLMADVDLLVQRLQNDSTRPLLQDANREEKLRQLLATRQAWYQQLADLQLNANDSVTNLVQHIEAYCQAKKFYDAKN